jgi:hypothetical protein
MTSTPTSDSRLTEDSAGADCARQRRIRYDGGRQRGGRQGDGEWAVSHDFSNSADWVVCRLTGRVPLSNRFPDSTRHPCGLYHTDVQDPANLAGRTGVGATPSRHLCEVPRPGTTRIYDVKHHGDILPQSELHLRRLPPPRCWWSQQNIGRSPSMVCCPRFHLPLRSACARPRLVGEHTLRGARDTSAWAGSPRRRIQHTRPCG